MTHLLGNTPLEVIENRRQRYFLAVNGEPFGPYSYYELERMIKDRDIDHQALFAVLGSDEWNPAAKLPLPHIPAGGPPEGSDIPHESEWEARCSEEVLTEAVA